MTAIGCTYTTAKASCPAAGNTNGVTAGRLNPMPHFRVKWV